MIHTIQKSERLNVVDALRGFALLAIVLLHNLEHYNLSSTYKCNFLGADNKQ